MPPQRLLESGSKQEGETWYNEIRLQTMLELPTALLLIFSVVGSNAAVKLQSRYNLPVILYWPLVG